MAVSPPPIIKNSKQPPLAATQTAVVSQAETTLCMGHLSRKLLPIENRDGGEGVLRFMAGC